MARRDLVPEKCLRERGFEAVFECATRAHGVYRIAFKRARGTGRQMQLVERLAKESRRAAGGHRFRTAKRAWHRQRR